jgi:putative cardiolipin synthase
MNRLAARRLASAFGLAAALVLTQGLSGCATTARDATPTTAAPTHTRVSLPDSPTGVLASALADGARAGESSLIPLESAIDALAARLALVDRATVGIDLQTYIYRPDASGSLLAEALWRAAGRGVRVRLLLDDWGARPSDAQLQALAAHPGVEVRLFNPIATPGLPLLGLLLDFDRANRRMHNKLMVVDGSLAILGGRNVGDEYFARHGAMAFGDLDVLLSGPAVTQAAQGFDAYWNDPRTVRVLPGEVLAPPQFAETADLLSALEEARWPARLAEGRLPRFHGPARALQDPPGKADPERSEGVGDLGREIARVVGAVSDELMLVSPYFVPGDGGVEQLRALSARGVRVTIVTNSLAATDVPAVHAGYARYRRRLLEAGIVLYEIRTDAPRPRSVGRVGSSRLSLHAKVMVVDGRSSFVGSMNIDPRSLRLNTENGLVMNSASLARVLDQGLRRDVVNSAYRVDLDDQGRMRWTWQTPDGVRQAFQEPGAGLWLRLQARLLSWLPIESLL